MFNNHSMFQVQKHLVINITLALTSWSTVLLDTLFVPTSYGHRRFITVFTRARYWSLSWAKQI